MKKIYQVPTTKVVELHIQSIMLSMSSNNGLQDTSYGGQTQGQEADANGHRGQWGDLWN